MSIVKTVESIARMQAEIDRLTAALAEAVQSAHDWETHGAIKYVAVAKERDAAFEQRDLYLSELQRIHAIQGDRDMQDTVVQRTERERDAALARAEAAEKERDDARAFIDQFEKNYMDDANNVLNYELKKWGLR